MIALVDAIRTIEGLDATPLHDSVAAISVGLVDGVPILISTMSKMSPRRWT